MTFAEWWKVRRKPEMEPEQMAELRDQIKILQQTLMEVAHAQRNGSSWYTRGETGVYQQVALWVSRGQTAINKATKILTPNSDIEGKDNA